MRERITPSTHAAIALTAALLALGALPSSGVAEAQEVLISEFVALNDDGLVDEDGDTSDWIEFTNVAAVPIDLGGWYVTDNALELDRWRLPDGLVIAPGDFLIVFASGKDRAVAGQELHADFELDGNGEYLALVRPDGVTIEHEFAPEYPRQREDVAYGIAQAVETDVLVPRGAACRVLVPMSGALGSVWTAVGFDDATWTTGITGVGFETADDDNGEIDAEVIDLAPEGTPSQSSTLGSFSAFLAIDGDFGNFTHTAAGQNLPATWQLDLGASYALESIVLHNRSGCCGSRLRDVEVFVLDSSGAVTVFRSGLLNPENALGAYPNGPSSLTVDLVALTGGLVRGQLVRVTRTPDPDLSGTNEQGNSDEADVLSLAEIEVFGQFSVLPPGFGDLVQSDIEGAAHGVNASVFVRVPFTATAVSELEVLRLRMHYDDGFIAYLNGVEVARRNAPAVAAWSSAATAEHPDELATLPEDINISVHRGLLVEGANVLAIHALNVSPDDTDLLVLPELVGQTVTQNAARFLPEPTPGAPNTTAGIAGYVEDTRFSVDRGFYTAPFEVEITTATADAQIRYTLDGTPPSASHGSVYDAPILIDRTTTLRAIAVHPELEPTNVDTHTYLFVEDIVRQDEQATLAAGFPPTWGGIAADYGMDPDVIGFTGPDRFGGRYNATIRDDLRSLPTISIVLPTDDMFGSRGIYTNSTSRGVAWERACSVELIHPDGAQGFQEDCGIRIQGGAFRSDGLTKKHSFRLLFKEIYGRTKLRYPLMGEGAIDRFDTFTLRAGANDGYSWDAARLTEQYTRDEFGRQLQLATGNLASRGIFVHLYINGVYWGLYNPAERPDHSFSAQYMGGDKDSWDALNSGSPTNGNTSAWSDMLALAGQAGGSLAAYQELQGLRIDGTLDPDVAPLLDVQSYVDYLLVNLWGGNWDWPWKNWWATRLRGPDSSGFRFFCWDYENTMGNNRGRSPLDKNSLLNNFSSAGEPHVGLSGNLEYRLLFADRAQRFLFNGGVLTPESLIPRYEALADEVERAIVAESARWGDQHHATPLTLAEWQTERDWLVNTYLPQRTAIVIDQLRGGGLYPAVDPPVFSRHGGPVAPGFDVALQAPGGGSIFYTIDGSDPRLLGGGVSPTAIAAGSAAAAVLLSADAPGRAFVPSNGTLGLAWIAPDFDDSSWTAGSTGVGYDREADYDADIGLDVEAEMYQSALSVYVRVPFTVADPEEFAFLTLRMKYDDGFVAYLNGEKVAERNAPAAPQWDDGATSSHEATAFDTFDITDWLDVLRAGENVLAIHGLNSSTGSSDMLVLPELSASAGAAAGGLRIDRSVRVRARTQLGGEWSALDEAAFSVGTSALRITELMFHPPAPPPGSPFGREDFEFIELQNVGDIPLNLTDIRFSSGVVFSFPDADALPEDDLKPGEVVLVVSNLEAFATRYDTNGLYIAGEYSGKLSNGGELVLLVDRVGQILFDFVYSDDWYPSADGAGSSLEIVDQTAPHSTWALASSWEPSVVEGGTPGVAPALGPGPGNVPGDINRDRVLNISDGVAMLVHLFVAPRDIPCDASGRIALLDVNGDGGFNVSDAISVLDYLFRNGPAPVLGELCAPIEGCPDNCAQ